MKRTPSLIAAVQRCLQQLGLDLDGVVAVSGGSDSVALLRALVALRGRNQTGRLTIAHFNHQLRGPESDADENFVRELPARLSAEGVAGLECRCDRGEVRQAALARCVNLEAAARAARYEFLRQVAVEMDAGWIATGHTADDQAETVLHRLFRGAGLKGLRGIAVQRPLAPGIVVVRPMLAVRRAEVLAYLREEQQDYREDSSNLDLDFTRNRIRRELLPHLAEHYNPAIATVLGRLAGQADELHDALEQEARALLAVVELPRAATLLVFRRQQLAAVPRHRIRVALRFAWEREGWPQGAMTFAHWDRLAGVVLGEGDILELPHGIWARCRERVVLLGPGS